MPVCTRCRARLKPGLSTCNFCNAPVMEIVGPAAEAGEARRPRPRPGADPFEADPVAGGSAVPAPALEFGSEDDEADDRLVLLLEEPLPEMAAMIQEFLQNSGIACVLKGESIGRLYRLPSLASFSGAKVYVRSADFTEARELVAHFFKKA